VTALCPKKLFSVVVIKLFLKSKSIYEIILRKLQGRENYKILVEIEEFFLNWLLGQSTIGKTSVQ
jgi:hypothetical protein